MLWAEVWNGPHCGREGPEQGCVLPGLQGTVRALVLPSPRPQPFLHPISWSRGSGESSPPRISASSFPSPSLHVKAPRDSMGNTWLTKDCLLQVMELAILILSVL